MVLCSSLKITQKDMISMGIEEDEVPEHETINELLDIDSAWMSNDEGIVPKFLEQSNTLKSLLHHVIPENSDSGKIQEIKIQEAAEPLESDLEFENWALKAKVTELEENLRNEKTSNAQYSHLSEQLFEELYKKDPVFWEQYGGSSTFMSNAVTTDWIGPVTGQTGVPPAELQNLVQPMNIDSSGIFVASPSDAGTASANGNSLQLVNATELLQKMNILQQKLSKIKKEKTEYFQLSQQFCQKWTAHKKEIRKMSPNIRNEFDPIIQNMLRLTALSVSSNAEVKLRGGQDSAISSSSSSAFVTNSFSVSSHDIPSAVPQQAQRRPNGTARLRRKITTARGKQFECDICGKAYLYPGSLHHHMKIHRLPNRGQVECPLCGTKVARDYSLSRHQKSQQCMKARKVGNTK